MSLFFNAKSATLEKHKAAMKNEEAGCCSKMTSKHTFFIYGFIDVFIFLFFLIYLIVHRNALEGLFSFIIVIILYFPNVLLLALVLMYDSTNTRFWYQRWLRFKLIT